MSNKALDLFEPTCKDGAKWYACEATSSNRSPFVGCCKTDPCSISGCALGNLAPVSFNASAYGTLPDPSCGSASTFYSCVNIPKNDTTFWGCCKTNACNHQGEPDNKSCPQNDLTAAVLDTASLQQAYSIDGKTGLDNSSGGSSHTGVIVGAVVGGVAVVAIIALLVFCLFKKRRNAKIDARPASSSSRAAFPGQGEKTEYRHSAYDEGTNTTSTLSPATPASAHMHPPRGPHDHALGISNASLAPPLYNSPKPPPFAAFGQHQYAPVAQSSEPQELPADFTAGGTQRYSELPAEGAHPMRAPAELESPMVSPQPFASPRQSPKVPQSSRAGEGTGERPGTADTTYRVSLGGLGIASPR
ncbi:uncharacterized protein CC84DRAFT_1257071 [Paraphaeosphaeria sporulosa]|uniref:Uncharacterized protein n=1 Tax=Paraphaeosphaeria sporulosa TaxID=1460663 RepID=A0A177CMR1_9PLEO|nr:uncharacterized protein CC84DRAFT_1257071 [Paraphaeosphaeria sporulosa]OAG08160.1 hypothetical protein CC84DRAFT_1257071 [Paraphaeosphaeria sporulosa]